MIIHDDFVYKGQFILNGREVGSPWYLESDAYYPTVAIQKGNTIVRTNFGEDSFELKGNVRPNFPPEYKVFQINMQHVY